MTEDYWYRVASGSDIAQFHTKDEAVGAVAERIGPSLHSSSDARAFVDKTKNAPQGTVFSQTFVDDEGHDHEVSVAKFLR